MDKTDSSSISTKDKIEIIAKHIGDDFGEKEVMRFRGAVTVYASTGRDCYQRKEKAPLAKMWDKTRLCHNIKLIFRAYQVVTCRDILLSVKHLLR